MDRWSEFSEEELLTMLGALSDSGGQRSKWEWYVRCSRLHTEIIDEFKARSVKPDAPE